jgi:hypothetical protein
LKPHPEAPNTNVRLEIAHVLFIDIVGYSIRPTDEQQALVDRLNKVVRSSDEFNRAAAAGRLKKIPTGDGMALIFHDSPEQPVECSVEISRVLMMDCGDAGHILLSKRVAEDPTVQRDDRRGRSAGGFQNAEKLIR